VETTEHDTVNCTHPLKMRVSAKKMLNQITPLPMYKSTNSTNCYTYMFAILLCLHSKHVMFTYPW